MPKLINKTRFTKFANDLWTKIKNRYDNSFNGATISASNSNDKKITLTRVSGTNPVDVSLEDYARLQDRNEFKKDVSVDDADFYNNSSLGNITGTVDPTNRTLGARNLTSKMFTDGFVSTLRIHLDSSNTETDFVVHLWEIKKGNSKREDRTISKLKHGERLTVTQVGNEKYVDIAINKKYEEDTYFLFRSSNRAVVKAISNIPPSKANDVMNLVDTTPPDGVGQALDLNNQRENETAYVEIFGRMGIVDLNKKLKEVKDASCTYVKHSETTATGGNVANAGQVVKLDQAGKLNSNMLPSIAIGEYFEINEFTDSALRRLDHYENGDTVVVTSGVDAGSRYFCINKGVTGTLTDAFIKLNDKAGIVTSVNEKTGAIVLGIASTTDKLQLKVNDEIKSEIDIISDDEINSIIASLS